jgi:hypothetical protein
VWRGTRPRLASETTSARWLRTAAGSTPTGTPAGGVQPQRRGALRVRHHDDHVLKGSSPGSPRAGRGPGGDQRDLGRDAEAPQRGGDQHREVLAVAEAAREHRRGRGGDDGPLAQLERGVAHPLGDPAHHGLRLLGVAFGARQRGRERGEVGLVAKPAEQGAVAARHLLPGGDVVHPKRGARSRSWVRGSRRLEVELAHLERHPLPVAFARGPGRGDADGLHLQGRARRGLDREAPEADRLQPPQLVRVAVAVREQRAGVHPDDLELDHRAPAHPRQRHLEAVHVRELQVVDGGDALDHAVRIQHADGALGRDHPRAHLGPLLAPGRPVEDQGLVRLVVEHAPDGPLDGDGAAAGLEAHRALEQEHLVRVHAGHAAAGGQGERRGRGGERTGGPDLLQGLAGAGARLPPLAAGRGRLASLAGRGRDGGGGAGAGQRQGEGPARRQRREPTRRRRRSGGQGAYRSAPGAGPRRLAAASRRALAAKGAQHTAPGARCRLLCRPGAVGRPGLPRRARGRAGPGPLVPPSGPQAGARAPARRWAPKPGSSRAAGGGGGCGG